IYNCSKGRCELLTPPGNIMFLRLVNGEVLFQKIGGGIYRLLPSNSFQLLPGTGFLSDKKVVSLLPDGAGGVLIATAQHGIYNWKNGQAQKWHSPLQEVFTKKQLNKGIRLSDGSYAFGTILDGLFLLDSEGRLVFHLNRQKGLPDNTVLSLLEDSTGNLWVGLDRGIALVDLKNPLLFHTDTEGDLGTVYTAESFGEHLYLGTNHGVFYKSEKKKNEPFRFVSGTQGQVWQLKTFGGQLLCGHNDGTFVIENGQARKISPVAGGWATMPIPNQPGLLLQGTYSGLIVLRQRSNGQWVFSHRIGGLLIAIREMVIDSTGAIWLAHPIEGLYRVVLDSSLAHISFLKKYTPADGLPSLKMLRLAIVHGETIIKSGQAWYRYEKGHFTQNGQCLGQPLSKIKGHIFPGRKGEWLEALPGEVVFHSSAHTRALPVSLVSGYENIVRLRADLFLLCRNDGYALLDADNLLAEPPPPTPPLLIHTIEIVTRKEVQPLPPSTSRPSLKKNQNRLRFRVGQHLFTRRPLFRYRLDGLDGHWSEWTEKNRIEYFNLPAGEYTFEAQAKHGSRSIRFSFSVLPHWTQSPPAFFGYALAFFGLLALVRYFFKKRFEKAKRKMEAEQKRLLAQQQMKAANDKLQMEVVNKSKQLANSTINLAKKNEVLLQLKKELRKLKNTPGTRLPGKAFQQLLHVIDAHLSSEQDWELFEKNFNQVHESFFKKLKNDFPDLTPGDLQLAAYLKMNLSSKEIAPLLHISVRGVENKRYRLRKKLGLPPDGNLVEFMMKY
ncbi:MAG TPA: hypothetical protein ENJ20_03365, partial [Bacteroidetes bacterium]|nr:hypothetical protein [Bacteroidota bacterium]